MSCARCTVSGLHAQDTVSVCEVVVVRDALVRESVAMRNTVKRLHTPIVSPFPRVHVAGLVPTVMSAVHGLYISLQFPLEVSLCSELTDARAGK